MHDPYQIGNIKSETSYYSGNGMTNQNNFEGRAVLVVALHVMKSWFRCALNSAPTDEKCLVVASSVFAARIEYTRILWFKHMFPTRLLRIKKHATAANL